MFPGQGSQKAGMGTELFERFAEHTRQADAILGYSIRDLCVEDADENLVLTQYTQPALYVVNALTYLAKLEDSGHQLPDYVAGHSLGEYNALFAAGSFDFETGLKLVQKRGELMSQAQPGGMAAVIRMEPEAIKKVLEDNNLTSLDMANFNEPAQTVISGPRADIEAAEPIFKEAGAFKYAILKVSSAFHSRYMQDAKEAFESFLNNFTLRDPAIPVISNVEARPYESGKAKQMLADQITHSVRWTDTINYLMDQGETEFEEVGPGKVLGGLLRRISKARP